MNLLFDFDGTICDSLETFLSISNPTLARMGKKEITAKEVRSKGVRKLLAERGISIFFLPLLIIFIRIKFLPEIPKLEPFDGIGEVLDELAKKNALGIVTTNSKKNVEKFLENNDLDKYFSFVHSSINYFNKGSKIEKVIKGYKMKKSETYFIGDETRDIESAKRVGIKTIAVTWGIESKNLLKKSHSDKLISKPTELLTIF